MCCKPLVMVDFGVSAETGKHILKMKRVPLDYDISAFLSLFPKGCTSLVPCGHCPECIMAYRKDWAIRCVCESKQYLNNCFITLTMDDDHYEPCTRKAFTDFIKALRNDGHKIRYFACSESGLETGREHYHACLFGYMPSDLKFHGTSDSGEPMYISQYLNEKWQKGFVIVQDFSASTAQYVAGYVSKKFGVDDGFLMMSSHPGLGYDWYQKNKNIIYNFDRVYVGMSEHGSVVPRYFLKLLEKDGFDVQKILDKRRERAQVNIYQEARDHGFDFIDMNYKYKEFFALKKMSHFRRSL